MDSFVWFMNHRGYETCSLTEVRAFFHYLNHGHKEPGGRWGNPRCTKPVTSGRARSLHSTLRTFFRWLITETVLDASPLELTPGHEQLTSPDIRSTILHSKIEFPERKGTVLRLGQLT
jgi:site-specific recombinase XerD